MQGKMARVVGALGVVLLAIPAVGQPQYGGPQSYPVRGGASPADQSIRDSMGNVVDVARDGRTVPVSQASYPAPKSRLSDVLIIIGGRAVPFMRLGQAMWMNIETGQVAGAKEILDAAGVPSFLLWYRDRWNTWPGPAVREQGPAYDVSRIRTYTELGIPPPPVRVLGLEARSPAELLAMVRAEIQGDHWKD